MESATLSKYVPANRRDISTRNRYSHYSDRVRGRYSHYSRRIRGRDTAIAAAAISTARAVLAAILSESGIRSYAADRLLPLLLRRPCPGGDRGL
nr:hypothetical protein [Bacillus velezensis]